MKANQTEEYVDFWCYECVKGSLADYCADYSTGKQECRRIKKFKKECPEAAPNRKALMVNGKMRK